ncbi:MAG: FKBP-type peptidyl-prolyl cis-trans isomerase [Planctomycetes bacterium]|nr:FKBP-type peptidyl-prolyl cis-trans isomerase [Planctomycetota bacterium]
MKAQGVEINIDIFTRGFQDAFGGKPLALTSQQQSEVMTAFRARIRAKQLVQKQVQGQVSQIDPGKNLQDGKAFLEQNAKKPGITTRPSGLQYRIIKEGTGKIPTANNSVKTHYRGTLINGTEFDSSYKRNQPATFGVLGVIKGWTEALQLMKVGAKWELFIPAELAYGSRGRPSIPPNSALIFEIELLEILP